MFKSPNDADAVWEQRVVDLWKVLDDHDPESFVAKLDILVAELPRDSAMRNLGNAKDAAELLSAELHAASDELDGAARAFLALALVDLGREREAVAISLAALSHYLPRYNRSLPRYAQELAANASEE